MSYSIELRKKVQKIDNFDDFFLFVKEYRANKKVYAFCFFVFLEKLCGQNKKKSWEFLDLVKNNSEVSSIIVKIMENILYSKGKQNAP
jgi:hypothetical protein